MGTSAHCDLIIFDLDGTLAPFNSTDLYPDAAEWLRKNSSWKTAIATNQGGIGLRLWMETANFGEPHKYPTLQDWDERLNVLFPFGEIVTPTVYMCAAYQSRKSGQWSPTPVGQEGLNHWRHDWRKPAPGMLLAAMEFNRVAPDQTLMVGDGEEDRQAAKAAGCFFQWAWEFFGRPQPLLPDED